MTMKAILVIPTEHAPEKKIRLTPNLGRGGKANGFQLSPATICRVLDGMRFQDLRDVLGARIETDDVESAAAILNLARGEPGLVRRG